MKRPILALAGTAYISSMILVVFALAGCVASGAELDREVSVAGMTMSVPSDWVEERDEEYLEDYGFGYRSYTHGDSEDDDFGSISVSYAEAESEDDLETHLEGLDENDMEYEASDGPVIDGVQTYIVEHLYDGSLLEWIDVLAFGPETSYQISLVGSQVSVDELLNTVSFD